MTDLISRADAIEVLQQFAKDEKPTDEMSKEFQKYQYGRHLAFLQAVEEINALPSADAVPQIHDDGTLEVKVPNATKVGRVLVIDTDSHIGGGLFYPESVDAVQGEWVDWLGNGNEWECSVCKCSIESHGSIAYKYCPMCEAIMKGGDDE